MVTSHQTQTKTKSALDNFGEKFIKYFLFIILLIAEFSVKLFSSYANFTFWQLLLLIDVM